MRPLLSESTTGVLGTAITVNDDTWPWAAKRHGFLERRDDQF